MNLIIGLLVFALVVWLVYYILGMLPIPSPAKEIVLIIFAVIFLLKLLTMIGVNIPDFSV